MKAETIDKMHRCTALNSKTVEDILALPRFRDNLSAYWRSQKDMRKSVLQMWKEKGFRAKTHVIDKLLTLNVEDIIEAWKAIYKNASSLPRNQRQYISQLVRQAYNLTIAEIVCEEFPELRDELLPKSKSN